MSVQNVRDPLFVNYLTNIQVHMGTMFSGRVLAHYM